MFLSKVRLITALLLLLTLNVSSTAFGVPYTWSGTGNWNTPANWGGTVPGSGDTGTISSGEATINTQLTGGPDIFVDTTGTLFWNASAVPATTGTIEVSGGGLLQFEGNTSGTPTTVVLEDDSHLGRHSQWTSVNTSIDNFEVATGGTAYVDAIRSHVAQASSQRFEMQGLLSGDGTLVVKPGVYTGDTQVTGSLAQGQFRLAPSSATGNTFSGTVEVEGLSATQWGILALSNTGSGAGALAHATLDMKDHGLLIMAGATDAFGDTAKSINFLDTNRVWWEGSSTYTNPSPAFDNVPTFNLVDGTRIGRYNNWTSVDTANEILSIASGDTVQVDVRSHVALSSGHRFQAAGPILGDGFTTLMVRPDAYTGDTDTTGSVAQGQFRIAPTTANTGFLGTVHVEGLSSTQFGILGIGGTGALSNATLSINDHSMIVMAGATDPFGSTAKTINFLGNSRILWDGASSYTNPSSLPGGNVATFNLVDGTRIGRYQNWTSVDTIRETLNIASGATVYADFILSHIAQSGSHRLQMTGELIGDGSTKLVVRPNDFDGDTLVTASRAQGQFRIAPTSASGNTGFLGTVEVSGLSATQHGIIGLGGTGAFVNGVSHLDLLDHVTLNFGAPTDPFGTAATTLNILGTNRVFWTDASTYTSGVLTLDLNDGAQIGRYDRWTSVDNVRENLNLVSGATVYADAIRAHIAGTPSHRMDVTGALSGDSTTKLIVRPGLYDTAAPGTGGQGALGINPSAVLGNTGFSGTVEVSGISALAGQVGMLKLDGVAALGSGTLDIQPFGAAIVTTNGALNGAGSVAVHSGGILRIQNNATSQLEDTTLSGTGLVRVESINTASLLTDSSTLQALELNNVIVAPGFSAGTLTFEATAVTLGLNSQLNIELGGSSDLIQTDGFLVLDPTSVLNLYDLPGINVGTYIIANAGTVTGEFGTINSFLNGPYVFEGITYGADFISVQVGAVPEPSSGLLSGLAVIGGLLIRRRKRAAKA